MRSFPHTSRDRKEAVRRTLLPRPVATADDRPTSNFPSASEVLGEIGATLAIHLVVALAITLTLQAYGIF